MNERPELYVECSTAVVTTKQAAAALEDDLEDVLEAHLHPYGDLEPPEGEEGALLSEP